MKTILRKIALQWDSIPSFIYLSVAIIIFAASSAITQKIINIGAQHLINGRNPISPCNVLFVGNICAFLVMIVVFYRDWQQQNLKKITRKDWLNLTLIGILSGAIAPGLIFAALDNTNVTNIILIGRLEPPLTLTLSVWLLGAKINFWTIAGSLFSFLGVGVTAWLTTSTQTVAMMGGLFHLGKGELQAAIAAIILAITIVITKQRLQDIPLGIFSTWRTIVGTIIFFILARYLYGAGHFAEVFLPFLWGWMLIYGAIIVVAGQLFWFQGLRGANPTQINLANSCYPLLAIAMAYLILKEIPTMAQYVGGCLILVGIVCSFLGTLAQNYRTKKAINLTIGKQLEMTTGFRGI